MKPPKKDKPKKKKDKQKKKKGYEFSKSDFGKWHYEEPTGHGFKTSDLVMGKVDRKIKGLLGRDRKIKKKVDSENQRSRRMGISQAEWVEIWERIFGSKEDRGDIEVKKE